jgi:hypothetical protein
VANSTAPVSQVLQSVRSHLNDLQGEKWPDPVLFPFLQTAHREMQLRLVIAGAPVLNTAVDLVQVPAGTVDLSACVQYPTNIIEPIWMKERAIGQQRVDFVDMQQVDFIPDTNQTTELVYWAWVQNTILLLGSVNSVEVQLRYRAGISVPKTVNDQIGIILGENYLEYRIAALALDSVPSQYRQKVTKDMNWTNQANQFLEQIVRGITKEMQALPAKRRAYHRSNSQGRIIRDF